MCGQFRGVVSLGGVVSVEGVVSLGGVVSELINEYAHIVGN